MFISHLHGPVRCLLTSAHLVPVGAWFWKTRIPEHHSPTPPPFFPYWFPRVSVATGAVGVSLRPAHAVLVLRHRGGMVSCQAQRRACPAFWGAAGAGLTSVCVPLTGHLRGGFLLERGLVPEDHGHLPRPLWLVPGLGRLRVAAVPLHAAGEVPAGDPIVPASTRLKCQFPGPELGTQSLASPPQGGPGGQSGQLRPPWRLGSEASPQPQPWAPHFFPLYASESCVSQRTEAQ